MIFTALSFLRLIHGLFLVWEGTPRLSIIRFLPPSPTLFSTSRLLILENFASLPFYSRLPVY